MKFLIGFAAALLLIGANARAEGQCEFLAKVAASEEAILRFDEFQSVALLAHYAQMIEGQDLIESYIWGIDDNTAIHVTTRFDGTKCEILKAYAANF
jgi:hypothetical protein